MAEAERWAAGINGPAWACLTEGSALRCQGGLSWAGWPACRRIIRLLEKSGFQGLFSRAPGRSARADSDHATAERASSRCERSLSTGATVQAPIVSGDPRQCLAGAAARFQVR
jgi:hypothetical protein